jgi:hypothetical protein
MVYTKQESCGMQRKDFELDNQSELDAVVKHTKTLMNSLKSASTKAEPGNQLTNQLQNLESTLGVLQHKQSDFRVKQQMAVLYQNTDAKTNKNVSIFAFEKKQLLKNLREGVNNANEQFEDSKTNLLEAVKLLEKVSVAAEAVLSQTTNLSKTNGTNPAMPLATNASHDQFDVAAFGASMQTSTELVTSKDTTISLTSPNHDLAIANNDKPEIAAPTMRAVS